MKNFIKVVIFCLLLLVFSGISFADTFHVFSETEKYQIEKSTDVISSSLEVTQYGTRKFVNEIIYFPTSIRVRQFGAGRNKEGFYPYCFRELWYTSGVDRGFIKRELDWGAKIEKAEIGLYLWWANEFSEPKIQHNDNSKLIFRDMGKKEQDYLYGEFFRLLDDIIAKQEKGGNDG